MIKNYFKIAWRNAKTNWRYTLISLVSLVLGIAIFLFIAIWAKNERSYDKQFANADRICRVETELSMQNGTLNSHPTVGWPVGKVLKRDYPGIENVCSMRDWSPDISFNGNHFYDDALYADNEFLKIFSYQLSEGDPSTALAEPYSLIISKSIKQKYFKNKQNVIGEILMVSDTIPYKVTGVFNDLSKPSHLKFDMIGSLSTVCALYPEYCRDEYASGWFDINMYNYIKLKANAKIENVASKIENLVLKNAEDEVKRTGFKPLLKLSPLTDIYLKSGMPTANGPIGSFQTVRLFWLIGIFILLIACLNFINLSTAKSVERAKEIGVIKILGGNRKALIVQFLTETAILCFVATLLSILLMLVLLPQFNRLSGQAYTLSTLFPVDNIVLILIILIVLIPVAGFYPSWVLSSYMPISVLKGKFSHSFSGLMLRKGLVVTQFVISIAFIMGALIVWEQMKFIKSQDLGFDSDKIIIVDANKLPWAVKRKNANAFKYELLSKPGIEAVTSCAAVPGRSGWDSQFAWPEGKPKDAQLTVEYIPVDENYVKTLAMKLVAGRDFVSGSAIDSNESLIVNETAVKLFGWGDANNAIGKKLRTSGKEGKVIGVLKDYHQHGLQQKINPIVLGMMDFINVFALKYDAITAKQAIETLEATWNKTYTGYPLEYSFMNNDFQRQYNKERKFKILFSIATAVSVFIACMGLLGLTIYTAQKSVKEIGVRKVLGASILSIVFLLCKDFLKLVIIAVIIAVPLAWWGMGEWLQEFAYRIAISWWIFALAGITAIVIALFAISFQAIKAALMNPVEALRSE